MEKVNGERKQTLTLDQLVHRLRGSAISLRENTKETRKTATENSTGRAATSLKVSIRMISGTDMERCIGLTATFIRATGSTASKMVLDSWSFLRALRNLDSSRRIFLRLTWKAMIKSLSS